VVELLEAPPVACRQVGDAVYIVGTAAGPLGDDDVAFDLDVGPGAQLSVRQRDAHLEPLVATSRCRLRVEVRIALAASARLSFTEELLLGRHGEPAGDLELRLSVEMAGAPLLRQTLRTGPDAPSGWDGPAVLGTARALGLRLGAGADYAVSSRGAAGCGWACSALEGAGILVTAVADDLPLLRRRMAAAAEVAFPQPQPARQRGS
jgi:urease accessory protein